MLVLKRTEGETILIGNDIVIKTVETKRGYVKIGIEAPASIRILRGEAVVYGKLHGSESGGAESVTEDVDQGRSKDA